MATPTPMSAIDAEALFTRRFVAYFAVLLVVCAFAYVGCVTFMAVPKENQRFADTVLGFLLGTMLTTIIVYFYGSSKSSQTAQATIAAIAAAPTTPTPLTLTPAADTQITADLKSAAPPAPITNKELPLS